MLANLKKTFFTCSKSTKVSVRFGKTSFKTSGLPVSLPQAVCPVIWSPSTVALAQKSELLETHILLHELLVLSGMLAVVEVALDPEQIEVLRSYIAVLSH